MTGPYAKCMLRLLDARSRRRAEVRLGRPHMLRVGAHVSQETGEPGWVGVRVLLIADLLTRVAELQGLQALTAVVFPGEPPAEPCFAERAAGLLGVHPPATRASSLQTAVTPGGPVDVHITGPGAVDDGWGGLIAQARGVRMHCASSGESDPAADEDPLAIRLALMSSPHDHAAELGKAVLARAGTATAQWRDQVAGWAESPSRPIPQRISAALDSAFCDLDLPRALALLTRLAMDPDVPDGARFETFVFADRVLGLGLARHIGRPHQ